MQITLAMFLVLISPIGLWLVLAGALGNALYEMDAPKSPDDLARELERNPRITPTVARYSFLASFAIYRQVYGAIFIAEIVLFVIALCRDARLAAVLLSASVCYSLMVVLWTEFCYESYQHQRYKSMGSSPYTGRHYTLTLTLGTMAPLLFAIGLMELVVARG